MSANRGPLATPKRARKAYAEARALVNVIEPLNLPYAAAYLKKNPPSWDAVVMAALKLTPEEAVNGYKSERASHAARHERSGSLQAKLRKANVWSYDEATQKARELVDELVAQHGAERAKRKISNAISKNKAKNQPAPKSP